MNFDRKSIMKALTVLAIEKSLLDIGKPAYDKVANNLHKKYKCYIPDCYEHPEYLEDILRSVFGNSHRAIMDSISEELMDNLDDSGIRNLVKTLS